MSTPDFLPPRGPEDIFPGDPCEAFPYLNSLKETGFILETGPPWPLPSWPLKPRAGDFAVACVLRLDRGWECRDILLRCLRVPAWRITPALNPLLLAEQKRLFAIFAATLHALRPDYCAVCGGEAWQHPPDCPGRAAQGPRPKEDGAYTLAEKALIGVLNKQLGAALRKIDRLEESATAPVSQPAAGILHPLLFSELDSLRTIATGASPDAERCLEIITRLTGVEIRPWDNPTVVEGGRR